MKTQIDEIADLLVTLGLPREKVPETIARVNAAAFLKALDAYILKLPETTREQIKSFSKGQLEEFFEKNASFLPKLSEEDLRSASEATWREYFETLSAEVDKYE